MTNSAEEIGFDREKIGTKLIFAPIKLEYALSIQQKIQQNQILNTKFKLIGQKQATRKKQI